MWPFLDIFSIKEITVLLQVLCLSGYHPDYLLHPAGRQLLPRKVWAGDCGRPRRVDVRGRRR